MYLFFYILDLSDEMHLFKFTAFTFWIFGFLDQCFFSHSKIKSRYNCELAPNTLCLLHIKLHDLAAYFQTVVPAPGRQGSERSGMIGNWLILSNPFIRLSGVKAVLR